LKTVVTLPLRTWTRLLRSSGSCYGAQKVKDAAKKQKKFPSHKVWGGNDSSWGQGVSTC
jgi:hypothetical protein